MLSKCANPECNEPFLYLCRGKLFRLEVEEAGTPPADRSFSDALRRIRRRTEYYWLCDACSRRMTVVYNKGAGVCTVPLSAFKAAS